MDEPIEFDRILERVRAICHGFEGTTEKVSHGEPSFFVAGRQYAMMDSYHHGSAHVSVWCAAPPGAQEVLIAAKPERFFRPPYVGHRGWVGIYLDGDPDWNEVAGVIADAVDLILAGGKRARNR